MPRVAANVVGTIRRELEAEDEQLAAEWGGLDALLARGSAPRAGPRSEKQLPDAMKRSASESVRDTRIKDHFVIKHASILAVASMPN